MKAQMELNGHYKEDYVKGIKVQSILPLWDTKA